MSKKLLFIAVLFCSIILSGAVASAHVVVKPTEVETGAFQTFTVSVPNEKETAATIDLKLEIPASLEHVSPTVKPGWTINVDKQGEGEEATVKSISWSGGAIGAGFRDDFSFSAKVPEKATELRWNAYQTYDDGLVVSWNIDEAMQPKNTDGTHDFSTSGPFSVTKVVSTTNTTETSNSSETNDSSTSSNNQATITAIAALIISLIALALSTKKPDKKQS